MSRQFADLDHLYGRKTSMFFDNQFDEVIMQMNFCGKYLYGEDYKVNKDFHAKVEYLNVFFSYNNVMLLRAVNCKELGGLANQCINYLDSYGINPFTDTEHDNTILVMMHGFTTFNIPGKIMPQDKIFDFYQCLNTDFN